MKNKNILVSVLIIIVAVAALLFLLRRHVTAPVNPSVDTALTGDKTVTFACADNKSIIVTFHLPEDKTVEVIPYESSDSSATGPLISLSHVVSADGARYANDDESIVFWNKGNSAFLDENGVSTYTNCNLVQE